MVSKDSGIGGYMASYGYDDETLQNLKEQAAQDYVGFKEDQIRKDQIAKITDPIRQTAGGFALDIPGMLGFEDYSAGPGILDAINIKKELKPESRDKLTSRTRFTEDDFIKTVLGAKEGLEEFLTYEPKQNPNLSGRYQDLLTGKYYDDEGNVTGVEKELRDYVRDIARGGRAYKVGEVSMYMLDAYGLPALLRSLPTIYKAASPYVKRIMQGSGLLGLTAASTDAEAKSLIKGFNAAVKTGSKFDELPASVQKKIEGTVLEDLGSKTKVEEIADNNKASAAYQEYPWLEEWKTTRALQYDNTLEDAPAGFGKKGLSDNSATFINTLLGPESKFSFDEVVAALDKPLAQWGGNAGLAKHFGIENFRADDFTKLRKVLRDNDLMELHPLKKLLIELQQASPTRGRAAGRSTDFYPIGRGDGPRHADFPLSNDQLNYLIKYHDVLPRQKIVQNLVNMFEETNGIKATASNRKAINDTIDNLKTAFTENSRKKIWSSFKDTTIGGVRFNPTLIDDSNYVTGQVVDVLADQTVRHSKKIYDDMIKQLDVKDPSPSVQALVRDGKFMTYDQAYKYQQKVTEYNLLTKYVFPGIGKKYQLSPQFGHMVSRVQSSMLGSADDFAKIRFQTQASNYILPDNLSSTVGVAVNRKLDNAIKIHTKLEINPKNKDLKRLLKEELDEMNAEYDKVVEQFPKLNRKNLPKWTYKNGKIKEINLKPIAIESGTSLEKQLYNYFEDVVAMTDLNAPGNKAFRVRGRTSSENHPDIKRLISDGVVAPDSNFIDVVKLIEGGKTKEAKNIIKLYVKNLRKFINDNKTAGGQMPASRPADTGFNAKGGPPIDRRLSKDNMFADPAGQVGVSAEKRDDDVNKRKGVFARYLDLEQEKAATQLGLESMPESQQKQMAFFLADPIEGQQRIEKERVADASVRYKIVPKEDSISNIQAKIAEQMIDAKPTKFPLSSFPKLLTENPLTKSLDRQMKTPFLILASAANDIINKMGGDEKQFYERFPRLSEYLSSGFQPVSATAQEAAYIDGIDEINRAMETGVRNLGFNTMDLILGGIDLTGFGDGKLSERLRENYEKTAKNDPETFMGDMIALLTEFGVPGGLVTKLITRFQKAMRLKGFNTMTRYIDDDTVGAARFAMQASNIAKRMGTGAVIFGAADFVGGGPYSSLKRMFPEDATLLPGKPIDTTDLSGADLALANFKNRVRFGADGALIGGLFPLLGPPAWALTKGTLALPFKTIPGVNRSVFGGALQLAGVPLKIAADSLAGKIPYTSKTIPLVGDAISYLGKQGATAAQATAAFIGKQVFTRAALGIYDLANARASIYTGIKPPSAMFTKSLPDFQTWRRFSVNSKDPLHQYLAKIDNKLAMFRDIGKLGKDAFATMTQSDLYIRSKSRAVEKYLIDIERIAYKLAKAFEERHQKYGEFETIQKKYLDDVLDFLEGTIRVDQLPKQLQVPANDLRNYTNSLKKEFGELLPTTDPIKYLIDADINSMMRRSFAAFTNNSYAPTPKSVDTAKTFIKDLIRGNSGLRMEAEMAFPNKTIDEAIDEYASLKVADIMHTAKYEMADPFRALENITRKLNLEDEIKLVTGDELPSAIKKLLGEEKNLRSSLLQTTGNIIASTSQKKSLDRIAEMGLANGWLFRTKEEALGKGILNAAPLTDVKGSGFLLNDAIGLYGTPEIIKQLGGYSLFDGFLKSTIYQNILAAKAMVQGGKTLYSPATQMRNVGSAALFALNVGHIGGSASVPQAFKIVMDDIFGPGRNVDKKQLNKFIERKIELGVIDENVVAQELTAILNDLKGATKETGEPVISSFNQLIQRVGNTQLSQYVQRLYAGGDNLWKLYGHEFYISELKQFTKSIDDVKRYFSDIVGREFVELSPKTGGKKTVMEGIEEIAAHLVRDTYPTYSRVPPAIQAIRKLPIGNFISFPAEMLRTTATTLSTSLKHIASGNPGLQSMGYRSLFGQFTTLYGVNEAVKSLGHTLTDVSPEAMRAYQDGLGPSFMENHLMVPLTNKDPQTGEFKAFDLSSYNPYAYVLDPIEGFIRELGTTRMSVDEVEGEVYNRIFDAGGPLMALIEPFTAETILLEPMFDIWARQGRARNGATVFSPTDDFGTKVSKSFNHIIGTVAPGFVRSTGQVLNALSLDTKQGRVSELADVFIRLLGGSIINVDPVSALDYKAIDIREIRSNAYKTEHFFSKENALERGPDVMAAEFQQIQNEALAAQFEVYKMFAQALDSGLLTRAQIESVLGPDGRNVPNLDNLMDGFFTPVSYSESGLEQRADELYKEYLKSGIVINRSDLLPLSKLDGIIFKMENIRFKDLVDPERAPLPNPAGSGSNLFFGEQQQEPVTPQLPDTPTPVVPNTNMNPVNPATGLTTTETALLSPGEQAIRQRQKGMA